jgi:site-specific recombinase XerC
VVRRVPRRPRHPEAVGAHHEGLPRDFDAIATLVAGAADLSPMSLSDITTDTMRTAFAQYAESYDAATIQRCWSTWNVLCTFLFNSELIAANPMPLVGRPKLAKTLPKALPVESVAALLAALDADPERGRWTDWIERDRALILTALLAGLRSDELLRANVGQPRSSDDGAVIHVRGKGGKDRRVSIKPALVRFLEHYLDDRATRFPGATKQPSSPGGGLAAWPAKAPLFVGVHGDRISRARSACNCPGPWPQWISTVFTLMPSRTAISPITRPPKYWWPRPAARSPPPQRGGDFPTSTAYSRPHTVGHRQVPHAQLLRLTPGWRQPCRPTSCEPPAAEAS